LINLQAQELLHEMQVRNKIRERLKARREKKKEEKLRQMEAQGITIRDDSSNSRSTASIESSESAVVRRQVSNTVLFIVTCYQLNF